MSRTSKLVLSLSIVFLLFAAFLIAFQPTSADVPDTFAAPTPATGNTVLTAKRLQNFTTGQVVTQSFRTRAIQVPGNLVDMQWVIDITDAQAATITLDYSNDGTNWVTGQSVVANATADASNMQQYRTFGLYNSLNTTLETTAPVTITLVGAGQ